MTENTAVSGVTISTGEERGSQTLMFRTPAEFNDFAQRELAFWQQLFNGSGNPRQVQALFRQLHQLTNDLPSEESPEYWPTVSARLSQAYVGTTPFSIPLSSSPAGQSIEGIVERLGPEAGIGALSATLPTGIDDSNFARETKTSLRGAVEQLIHEAGVTTEAVAAARRTLGGIYGQTSKVLAEVRSETDTLVEQHKASFAASEELRNEITAKMLADLKLSSDEYRAFVDAARRQLEATHKAYTEHMGLKAPVKYWEDKAKEHRKRAILLGCLTAGYFVALVLGYVWLSLNFHEPIADFLLRFRESPAALFIIAASMAVVASIPLWGARIIVRFYLSEMHLTSDAFERKTMTETYLALTEKGKAEEKERLLILGALFRATQDGIVKDTAAADTSLAGFLAKVLDPKSS